jgi:CheY-like chemotaxis protein
MMPEMDGFQFLSEMHDRVEWREIPVVVVTAKDLSVEERMRLNHGVERIIHKTDVDDALRELRGFLAQFAQNGNTVKTAEL